MLFNFMGLKVVDGELVLLFLLLNGPLILLFDHLHAPQLIIGYVLTQQLLGSR